MAKTIRNLPEWTSKTEWLCPPHQLNYLIRSTVRTMKGDRGDGKTPGWREDSTPTNKRVGKRIANHVRRRHDRVLCVSLGSNDD